jgi:hypothetical protein
MVPPSRATKLANYAINYEKVISFDEELDIPKKLVKGEIEGFCSAGFSKYCALRWIELDI